ncbi:hypothetical protein DH2020_008706 [Rehmannia glutinosa]|uniref:Uncharacterized protein n=1 Tax=Rehmannia glutinosa TaxID=99300 RepID=A0ABR0X562_REHGL
MKYIMDREIQTFTEIWLTAIVTLIFCHQIAARIPSGAARLLSLLPIIYLFTTLPLRLSSFHLAAPTIFYLVWLGNFKLLLFSFNQGPLSTSPPLSLLHFISIALLPIKTKQTPISPKPHQATKTFHPIIIFLLKFCLIAVIISLEKYREFIHPYLILALYCCHAYLGAELVLAVTAVPVRAVLGLELEPQFDEPYLATSLQDFWGRGGPAGRGHGDFRGVGSDARGDLLLRDACGPHVGGHVVLCSARVLRGGGGGSEKSVVRRLGAAAGGVAAADGGVRGGYRWVAVFPTGD